MTKRSITSWVDAPSVRLLVSAYGERLERMPTADKTALLLVFSYALDEVVRDEGEHCRFLSHIVWDCDIDINEEVASYLDPLFAEFSPQQVLSFMVAVLATIDPSELED